MYRSERLFTRAVVLLCLALSIPTVAASNNVSGSVTLASSSIFRGIERDPGGFTPSAYLEHAWSNGFFLGIWAGRAASKDHPLGNREVNYLAGFSFSPTPSTQVRSSLVHYRYPNSMSYRDYDWSEWLTQISINSHWILSYGLGENWFADDELSHFGEISRLIALPGLVVFDLKIGAVQLENAYLDDYQYLEAGLSRTFGAIVLRGMLSTTDSGARAYFGDRSAGRQASITLSWTF